MTQVKEIIDPKVKEQTVNVRWANGNETTETVHYDSSNTPYVMSENGRIYLHTLPNGEWLEKMLS